MIHAQATKVQQVIRPADIVDDASFTTLEIDTLGFDYAQIVFQLGATDVAMVALKVQESDDNGVADTYVDVPGLDLATAMDIDGAATALPSATDDNEIIRFDIGLKGRKRYLKLVATAGNGSNGTYATALAILSRAEITPSTSAECGCEHVLRV